MNTVLPARYGYREIWTIAWPILISMLMEHSIGLTDTAFLGRVGEVELGASALAGVYFAALFMLGLGFSIGAQIMISRRNGEGNTKSIGEIFYQGLFFLILLAGVMVGFSRIFTPLLLSKIIHSEEVLSAALSYLNWRIYGMVFAFVVLMFRGLYVGITQTRVMTINGIVMVLSNVVLNYGLIFGKFGLPRMGIAGAAIASTFAEFVSMVFYIWYTWRKVDWKKYGLDRFPRFNGPLLKKILGISVWMMIQSFLAVATWFIFFLAIEHQGERPLAVTNLVRSVSTILFMTINAFASTTNTIVGNLLGAGRPEEVMKTIGKSVRFSYLVLIPVLLVICLLPQLVLRLATNNWNLIHASVPSLLVMCSAYLVTTAGLVYFNAVSGTGNTRSALIIEFIALVMYMIYVGYVVVWRKADVAVCWTSEYVYGGMLFLFAYLYMKRGKWGNSVV